MSQAPSMPMYWDAYLADTTHLSTEEHGAYLLLLAAMWRRNGTVPNDDKDNARITGLSVAKWRRIKERISCLLIIDNDTISQKNLQKIWKNTQEKIAKNKKNGAKGGRPKYKENKELEKANGSLSDNPIKSIPEPEPEPYKELPSNEGIILSENAPSENFIEKDLFDEKVQKSDLSQEAFDAYNEMAERAGLPKALKLTLSRRSSIRARLKDCNGLSGWIDALGKVEASSFCNGHNSRKWVANLDFMLQEKSFTKIMEGFYANKDGSDEPVPENIRKRQAHLADLKARGYYKG